MKELHFFEKISDAVRTGFGEFIQSEEVAPRTKSKPYKKLEDLTYQHLEEAYDLIPPECDEVDIDQQYRLADHLKELYEEKAYISDTLLRELADPSPAEYTILRLHEEGLSLIEDLIEETPSLAHDKEFLSWAEQISENCPPSKESIRPKGIKDTRKKANLNARTLHCRMTKIGTTKFLPHAQKGNYSKRGRKKGPLAPDRKLMKKSIATLQKKMQHYKTEEDFFQDLAPSGHC